jgi:hypothetical protein
MNKRYNDNLYLRGRVSPEEAIMLIYQSKIKNNFAVWFWLIIGIVVFFTPTQAIASDSGPWWDHFPRIMQDMEVSTATSHHASIIFDWAQNDPGWGTYFQKWISRPDLIADAHAAGLKSISYYETFGQSMCFVAALGSWNGVNLTPVYNTHWSWLYYSGGTIRWLGVKNFFDDEDFARPYTRTHPRYGGPAMTYPDGTEATGYDGDPTDPRNSRVYDAGCSKNVFGEISLDYDYNESIQASGPYDGLLYISADSKYTSLISFSKDSACPAWIDYAYASTLMAADTGMDGMWSDNFSAWDSFSAWPVYCAFGDWSVARFRNYLASHFTTTELLNMGVTDPNSFDIRAELCSIALGWGWDGADLGSYVWNDGRWLDEPLWRAYTIFKRQTGTEALTNYSNAVHAAALEAGVTDFLIAGNDIPAFSLGWVRDNLDMVSTELAADWSLSGGPRGFMIPPIGRISPFYKLAREHALSRFVNVWLYDQGYEAYLHNPGICKVLYYEMLASHAMPMLYPTDSTFAGEASVNIAFFGFVSQVESVYGQRIPVEDIGVYYSSSSILSHMTPGGYLDHSAQPHQFAFWGWATALGELHYQYRAIPEWKLDSSTLADLRVLVIPESKVFEPNDVTNVLEPWVQNGGLLIVTGVSGCNLGEDDNFDLKSGGYSLSPLTGVTDIATAPAEQLQTIGAGKVLYIRDNIGMDYYNADTTRPSLLPQFDTAMTTVLNGSDPLVLTPGAGVTSRVGLSVFEDSSAERLFVDVTNFDIDLGTDTITDTSELTFSVKLPLWLQKRPLSVNVFSPESTPIADVNTISLDRVEVTIQPVRYYAGIVIESNLTADLNNDYKINSEDLVVLAAHWLETGCDDDNVWCGGADLNHFNGVDAEDFALFSNFWLADLSELIPNLVAHWKFDGDPNDSSGNNYHGTVFGGPVWDPNGQVDGALELDGIDDFVKITGYQGIIGSQSRTVAAWVKTTDTTNILTWGDTVTTGGKWLFRIDSTGALRVSVGGGDITGSIPVNDNGWHHVAAVFANDGTPEVGDVKFYIDGTEDTLTTISQCPINTVASYVRIGKWNAVYFAGKIDDVRIYSRALTEAEVQALAAMGD